MFYVQRLRLRHYEAPNPGLYSCAMVGTLLEPSSLVAKVTGIVNLRLLTSTTVIRHKCFHRYVVRAKRGTVQSVRDGKSGTSQPKSGGASIRRHNEVGLLDKMRC